MSLKLIFNNRVLKCFEQVYFNLCRREAMCFFTFFIHEAKKNQGHWEITSPRSLFTSLRIKMRCLECRLIVIEILHCFWTQLSCSHLVLRYFCDTSLCHLHCCQLLSHCFTSTAVVRCCSCCSIYRLQSCNL